MGIPINTSVFFPKTTLNNIAKGKFNPGSTVALYLLVGQSLTLLVCMTMEINSMDNVLADKEIDKRKTMCSARVMTRNSARRSAPETHPTIISS